MQPLDDRYFRNAGRWLEIPVGLGACALGAGGLYLGLKGFIAYTGTTYVATSDPLACTVGVLGGAFVTALGFRLVAGGGKDRPLFSSGGLLFAGIAILVLGVFLAVSDLTTAHAPVGLRATITFIAVGVGTLTLRRMRSTGTRPAGASDSSTEREGR